MYQSKVNRLTDFNAVNRLRILNRLKAVNNADLNDHITQCYDVIFRSKISLDLETYQALVLTLNYDYVIINYVEWRTDQIVNISVCYSAVLLTIVWAARVQKSILLLYSIVLNWQVERKTVSVICVIGNNFYFVIKERHLKEMHGHWLFILNLDFNYSFRWQLLKKAFVAGKAHQHVSICRK